MTDEQQPSKDPFLDEIYRMKREAVAGMDMPELVEKLRRIEKMYQDRMVQPPSDLETDAA